MGALLGLLLGLGLLLIWRSVAGPAAPPRRTRHPGRWRDVLARAGVSDVGPWRLGVSCLALGMLAGLAMGAVSRTVGIGVAFGVLAGYSPIAVVRSRARRRRTELRELWPEVVDNLASGIRAGLSLPEAISQLAVRGPEPLRPAFARFGEDYRATGRFRPCLDGLKATLADPVADRIVESVRVARDVGGADLGRLMRTLSAFLREDARVRAELESRQSWTVNGARLAVAAPWIVLGLLCLNPAAVAAYDSTAGTVVLAGGAAACVAAYRAMLRIGRLPAEERVLR